MQVLGVTIGLPTPIPILAKAVRAGFPSPADNFIRDEIDLQRLLVSNKPATFLVRVAGDSMMLAKLFDGDIAVVDRSLKPRNGLNLDLAQHQHDLFRARPPSSLHRQPLWSRLIPSISPVQSQPVRSRCQATITSQHRTGQARHMFRGNGPPTSRERRQEAGIST